MAGKPLTTQRVTDEARIEYRRLADLARWPRNPKAHDIGALKASLRRWGFVLPLVEDQTTGQLVAGHGRLQALLEMQAEGEPPPQRVTTGPDGGWLVPVVGGVAFDNEREAEGYLLADNRLVEAGGWDQETLDGLVRKFTSLEGTGFTQTDADALAAELADRERGLMPSQRIEGFKNAEVKQLVFYFGLHEWEAVLERLRVAQSDVGVDNQSALLVKLLDEYEARS